MTSRYKYGWNSANKKKVYMGKYPGINPNGQNYFRREDNQAELDSATGNKDRDLESKKSGAQEYTFSNTIQGTHTITAESYEEALLIAKSMGYTSGDYKKR